MNIKQSRTVRGFLIVLGFLTSNSVHLFASVRSTVASVFQAIGALAHNLRLYVAQRVSANLGFLFASVGKARVASSAVDKATDIIVITIILAISGYFVAALLPGVLTALATAALVSVSSTIASLIQTVLSISIVATVILLYIAIIRHVLRS